MDLDTDAATPAAPADWLALNRANWDARVQIHAASEFYDVAGFVAGRDTIRPFEAAEVGDVAGRTLLHLQCHMGMDTLSWARRGATVTGLDFSRPAVEQAVALAARIGADTARFVVSDVYDAAAALDGAVFDVVYTGLGALCWLPDLDRWARVVASLVAPGGFAYLAEFHPFVDIVADDGRTISGDYFGAAPRIWDEPTTYTDQNADVAATVSVDWTHSVASVVSALAAAGLRLEFLHERDFTFFQHLPTLVERDRVWRMPEGGGRIPLIYSLRAAKDR